MCELRNSVQIFTTIVSGRKLLAIVTKSPNLDIGRVSGSTAAREWNPGLDLTLNFTMHAITYLKREGQRQMLKKLEPIAN